MVRLVTRPPVDTDLALLRLAKRAKKEKDSSPNLWLPSSWLLAQCWRCEILVRLSATSDASERERLRAKLDELWMRPTGCR